MSKAIEFLKDYEANNKLEGKLLFDYNLAKSSWLGVGGKAEVFYHCDSVIQLSDILKKLPKEFNRTVIGQGSNILIRDGGIKGLVIKLGKSFQKIQTSNEVVIAGGAAMDKVIARYSQEESIGGFEFLSGIPGNIGGALAMNAGCYGGDISKIFFSAKGISYYGNKIEIGRDDFNFEYRFNPLSSGIIFTEISLKGSKDEQLNITAKIEKINKEKNLSQPRGIKTGGSTFKNPDINISPLKAWELIYKSECHNINMSGVSFSLKHYNFIENKQNLSANLIEDFCKLVQKNVFEKTGVKLDMEIKILGDR